MSEWTRVRVRFERHLVRMPNGCLEWTGHTSPLGYGRFKVDGRSALAHRVAWSLANNQPVPEGMCILHSCDNPPCCEPTHLRPGTNAENNADKMAKGRWRSGMGRVNAAKTHCPQGHEYSGKNLYMRLGRIGRDCKTCIRASETRRRKNKRMEKTI